MIIDDIEYSAATCAEAANEFDLGSDFYTTSILSVPQNAPIHSANVSPVENPNKRRKLYFIRIWLVISPDERWTVGGQT